MLTEEQCERYRRDGYLVLPGFKPPGDIAMIRARAEAIIAASDMTAASAFTTRDQGARTDGYFLDSGDKVRCFFEAAAFDEAGRLRQAKSLSINKIGHALHDVDPVFDAFSHGADWAALANDVGLARPLLWQSMYIFKQPGIGGEVRWHQDASFFVTDPPSVTTFWLALEAAHRGNGCLWVEPGGHRGPLREQFVRQGGAAHLERRDATPWPTEATAVPVEVQAGTLVLFHGLLPHYSAPNQSGASRHAYTLHATDARAAYDARNWLQRDIQTLRGF